MFRFAFPVAFLLIIVLVAWGWFLFKRPASSGFTYSDTRLVETLPVSWRVRLRRLPDVLQFIALVSLIIALARPQSGQGVEVLRGQGIDIVLVVDISTSMRTMDFGLNNRLQAAKDVIQTFIAEREFDPIGLVVFAQDAYQLVPLTLDYALLSRQVGSIQLIDELAVPQTDGTALGLGIASAATMLRDRESASQVIILLTDGNNNFGIDPLTIADAAAALSIRVYTIGMGRPATDETESQQGQLDEATLTNIAQRTDGAYFRATDTETLQNVYEQIDRLERSDVERTIVVRWQDQAIFWLITGLLLVIAEQVLRQTIFRVIVI
jgi:Ca-activated chloride channel homolog